MILEDATYDAFGYYPSALKPKSRKRIIAVCDGCGEFKITSKDSYRSLCRSCAKKGRIVTKEAKANMSAAQKGKYTGENSPGYKYGKRIAKAKSQAKRKRELGYILILPLKEGEEGHHVTDEYVIGIPKEVHQKLSGGRREKHRVLVLQWLKANDATKYETILTKLLRDGYK